MRWCSVCSASIGVYCAVIASAAAVMPNSSCTAVGIAHTNLPEVDAATALRTYLSVLEEDGGSPEELARLIVTRTMTARLTNALGIPSWDVFVLGSTFSSSIHCARYVEFAGGTWNVLLCQPHADHTSGILDDASADCRRGPHGVTLYENGTLALSAADWESGRAESSLHVTVTFHDAQDEGLTAEGGGRTAKVSEMIRRLPSEQVGPAMAQHLRRRAEKEWPSEVWNVIVEARSEYDHGFPNWMEDSKEAFHVDVHVGPKALNVILFRRNCFARVDDGVGFPV